MTDSDTLKTVFEGIMALGVVGGAVLTLLKLGAIGNQITNHGEKIDKIETTLETVAEQKAEIRAIRQMAIDSTARTDETFKRVFTLIDRLHERKVG